MLQRARNFDEQAASFDRRAGLPAEVCADIARAIVDITSLAERDVLLEVGAGTGQIGCALSALPLRYLGIDSSPAMLARFAQACDGEGIDAGIAVADAGRAWPLREASVAVIFGSRALHLLPPEHVADEVQRVAVPGAHLLIGRVEREIKGLRARLRREMRDKLARRGYAPREGRGRDEALLAALIERGAKPLAARVAARWPVRRTARELLAAWRAKSGLGGVEIAAAEKQTILDELADWAETSVGSLDTVDISEETYMLAGALLPGHSQLPRSAA